jgi:copper chaperone CopZ
MKTRTLLAALAIACATSVSAFAAETVTLSDVHLCCNNCVNGANAALKPTGATGTADRNAKTIVLTAPDKETLQKGANALIAAGYFGKSSDNSIKMDAASGAPDSKVQTATVTGVHLCCPSCVTTVKGVLGKVDGVKSNTVAPRATSFNVAGDFSPKSMFEALNAEGLAGKYSTAATTKPSTP